MDLTTAKKLLRNTKREDLIKIISKLSTYDDAADEWLLDYCNKHCEEEKNLVIQKQIRHYWDVAEAIIDEANEYGGTSYSKEEEAYDALSMIDDLTKKNKTPWTFRQQIVDEMMEQFYYGNSGFDDALFDNCDCLCQTKEEKLYLADALTKSGNGYYIGVAANIYLNCGEDEAFVETQSKNLRYGSDYIELADYYKKNKQPDKAVALVEEALSKADGRMDEVYRWLFKEYRKKNQEDKIQQLYKKALSKKWNVDTMVGLMYEYYSDDYDKKKPYLLKMPEVCDSRDIRKWFDECKNQLSEEDFCKSAESLYAILKKRNIHDYLQLRIDEGSLHEVWEYLRDNPQRMYGYSVDMGHNLTKQIADAYPKEVCTQYWKECEMLCSQSNKKNYMAAVQVLVEIKSISRKHKLLDDWESTYSAFLERHRRKGLLMGYIREQRGL